MMAYFQHTPSWRAAVGARRSIKPPNHLIKMIISLKKKNNFLISWWRFLSQIEISSAWIPFILWCIAILIMPQFLFHLRLFDIMMTTFQSFISWKTSYSIFPILIIVVDVTSTTMWSMGHPQQFVVNVTCTTTKSLLWMSHAQQFVVIGTCTTIVEHGTCSTLLCMSHSQQLLCMWHSQQSCCECHMLHIVVDGTFTTIFIVVDVTSTTIFACLIHNKLLWMSHPPIVEAGGGPHRSNAE